MLSYKLKRALQNDEGKKLQIFNINNKNFINKNDFPSIKKKKAK